MGSLHRILWIDQEIRRGGYPNSRTIAEQFEISSRQAARDIEYLRYSLGAPVEYCPGKNGYYYQGEAFVLPAQFLTRDEKDALNYLAFQYRSRGGGQAMQLAQLFSRLSDDNDGSGKGKVQVFNPAPEESKAYKILSQAQEEMLKVEMLYTSAGGADSWRVFCPYHFFCQGSWGYVAGFCELCQEIRIFKLERVQEVRVLEQRFQVVPWYDSEAYPNGFDYREPYTAVVRTDGGIMKAGLPVQTGEHGKYIIQFTNSDKLLQALLIHVPSFTILEPGWLRQRLQARLQKILVDNSTGFQRYDTICPTLPATMVSDDKTGGDPMKRKLDAKLGMTWTTYIGSVYGALRQAGLWDGEMYLLMGMTGMAFHFIMHETACPSSVTVYDWSMEHFAMLDRIGVHSEVVVVMEVPNLNTALKVQEDALAKIRASIDSGVPVVTWAPTGMLEFGLINGYDDEDEVLYIQDYINSDPDPLRYINLGISEVPILFIQTFKGRVEVDPEKVYRDSLVFGLSEWNKNLHTTPGYASGRKAYANLISTLERGDYDEFGLVYNLNVYAESKACIAKYLEFVAAQSRELKGLEEAVQLSRQVAQAFQKIVALAPFKGPESTSFERSNTSAVLDLVRQCLDLEDRAMAEVQRVLA